jgi:type I restriction enzyme S subunit
MKKDWTYKKLGEIGTFQRGGGFLKNDFVEEGFPCIHYGQIHTKFGVSVDKHLTCISDAVASKSKIAHNNDLIIAITSEDVECSCKCTAWLGGYDIAIGAHTAIYSHNQNAKYLAYVLRSRRFNEDKTKYAHGFKVVEIKPSDIAKIEIPIAPLEEQQQIVAELDLLGDVIEKQKAQIEELDKLSHSIFYDMFGDPVINNKGWNTSVLKNVSTLLNGRAYKQEELLKDGKYKVLRVGNFFTNGSYYYSDLELEDNKYCDYGDLLFAWSASFGAFIWQGEKVIYHYHIWKVLFDENYLNKIFYCYLLNTMTNSFMNDLHGIGMMHLTKVGMEQYILPLPPLSLQQEFAAKIEAIEAMKAKVRQSLKEAETLFNSRMDYYFN